ncbi:MAG: DUF2298 domain-containing protein [Candidatus Shapirobacteria bacterium]
MLIDFFTIIYWWLILLFLGILFLPLALKVFASFWDKGWILAKTLGILVLSFSVFLLASFHLLPFYQETIFLILIAWAGAFYWRLRKELPKYKKALLKIKKTILLEEGIFLAALLFWSFIRAFQPNIEGLEKFMDYGFVNSLLRSQFFPPKDMWFSGGAINYYYFGHLQAAVLTKLSGLDSATTYNLMIATLFALTFGSGFCLTANLVFFQSKKGSRKIKEKAIIGAAFISAFLLALGGNLHAVTYILKNGASRYWYPDATRFIGYNPNNPNDKTIHEFPSYSFVVADLHGHLNNLPAVLLFLASLLALGLVLKERKIKNFILPGFLLGLMYMTNSWDLPIYGVFLALFLLGFWLLGRKLKSTQRLKALKEIIGWGIISLLITGLTSLLFARSFSPMTQGIGLVNAHTLWWQFFVLWGFFWFLSICFWLIFIKSPYRGPAEWLTFSASFWALILIIIPEIIYVKDIYIFEYHRANTMFKLVYQSFVLFASMSGFIVLKVKGFLEDSKLYWLSRLFLLFFLLGFSAQMIYPFFAVRGYYGELKASRYQGLFGLNFLKIQYPGDFQLVLWIKKNIKNQPNILEAVGDSYTLYDRVSALTGLPTIEGWLVHEWLWRGGYDLPGSRAAEVEKIYQGQNLILAKDLLEEYQVEYVVVGELEKEKYPQLDENRFNDWGKIVFSNGGTRLYKLKL